MRCPKIRHPEWLDPSKTEEYWRLYRQGKVPKAIAGFMLVTRCKHDLRAIYGSDLRAALALLGDTIWGKIEWHSYGIRRKIGLLTKLEREVEEEMDEMDEKSAKSNSPEISSDIHRHRS